MFKQKGFTLIELTVTMIIVGILAAVAIPNYENMLIQGTASATANNMRLIWQAEKNYYFNNGYWCGYDDTTGQHGNCADNLTDMNTNLHLNITDNTYTYNFQTDSGPTALRIAAYPINNQPYPSLYLLSNWSPIGSSIYCNQCIGSKGITVNNCPANSFVTADPSSC